MSRLTRRWEGALAATVFLGAVGVLARQPSLLLAGVVPLAYAAYGSVAEVAVPEGVTVERTIDPTPAPPGRSVAVTLTVENGSDRTLSDCRVIDGVPAELAVVGGSPRAGVTLEPGDSHAVEYEVIARRGEHRFDPPTLAVRGLGGGAVERARPAVDGDAHLDCRLDAGAPPLREEADGFAGQLPTDRPGRGIEFHSVRRYATGDAARRIDWRHYARRGELATVNYEQPGVATVLFVVDARPPSRVVAGPGRPTAVELSAYAGTRALADLLGAGHEIGAAIVGADGDGPAGLHWLEPASGTEQRARAREFFQVAAELVTDDEGPNRGQVGRSADSPVVRSAEDRPLREPFEEGARTGGSSGTDGSGSGPSQTDGDGSDATEPDADETGADATTATEATTGGATGSGATGGTATGAQWPTRGSAARTERQVEQLLTLTGPGTQIVFLSPLLDDGAISAVETWCAFDRAAVVLSPDVVPENTVSGQFEAVQRRTRLAACQAAGARTIDWRRGTPLPIALEYAFAADARLGSLTGGGGGGGAAPAGGANTGGTGDDSAAGVDPQPSGGDD